MDKYQLALEVLSNRVNFFDIFPRFYLYYIKQYHHDIYNLICENKILENNDKEINDKLNKSVNDYLSVIDSMKEKSDYICDWAGCKDELGFFQEMMIECHFKFLLDTEINFFIDVNNKINSNEISKEEVLKLIGLYEDKLKYLRNKY